MLFEALKIVGAVTALLNTVGVFCAVKAAGDADRHAEELLEIAPYTDAEWLGWDGVLPGQRSLFADNLTENDSEAGGVSPILCKHRRGVKQGEIL